MKISELQMLLVKLQVEHGDLDVVLAADAEGNYFRSASGNFSLGVFEPDYQEFRDGEGLYYGEELNCIVLWP